MGDAQRGMNLELLEPWRTEQDNFLQRFLDTRDEGPHHLTFHVDDIEQLVATLLVCGITPVQVDLSFPGWKEAFLLPRDAHGTVVQLAASETGHPTVAELLAAARGNRADVELPRSRLGGNPHWWSGRLPSRAPVYLERVVAQTPDLEGAQQLFGEILGGAVEDRGRDEVGYGWPRGGRLQLRRDAPPGVVRLEVAGVERPFTLAGTLFAPLDK
jgi:hypothetical protein